MKANSIKLALFAVLTVVLGVWAAVILLHLALQVVTWLTKKPYNLSLWVENRVADLQGYMRNLSDRLEARRVGKSVEEIVAERDARQTAAQERIAQRKAEREEAKAKKAAEAAAKKAHEEAVNTPVPLKRSGNGSPAPEPAQG